MSHATLFVRFPDGEVRYGIYCGTSDVAAPELFDTADEAWSAGKHREWPDIPAVTGEAVEVATNYGGGFHWPGTATRRHLTSGFDPLGTETWTDDAVDITTDGLPEWAR